MRRFVFLLLSAAFLLSIAVSCTPAQVPQASPAFVLSPEAALIALAPYRLNAADAPLGYTVGGTAGPSTAVTMAAPSASPSDTFTAWQNAGFVVGYNQRLYLAAEPTAMPGDFSVSLFTNQTSAGVFATGKARLPQKNATDNFEPVTLGTALGDADAAWYVTPFLSGQRSQGYYAIRWQRGQLVFGLATSPVPLSQKGQADAESAAAKLNTVEQKRRAPNVGPATVTAPVSEAQRLQAALLLSPFLTPLDSTPDDYNPSGSFLLHPAAFVQGTKDPAAALHTIDQQWQWIVGAVQAFKNIQNSRVTLAALAGLCTGPQAAIAAIEDPINTSGETGTFIDSPLQLGDTTRTYRSRLVLSTGIEEESTSISWTHGALFFQVQMNASAGSTSMDQLAAFARQIEARFQVNPLPTRGLPDLTPSPTSTSSPPQ